MSVRSCHVRSGGVLSVFLFCDSVIPKLVTESKNGYMDSAFVADGDIYFCNIRIGLYCMGMVVLFMC